MKIFCSICDDSIQKTKSPKNAIGSVDSIQIKEEFKDNFYNVLIKQVAIDLQVPERMLKGKPKKNGNDND